MNKKSISIVLGVMCLILTYGIAVQIKTVNGTGTTVATTASENELRDAVLKAKEKYDNLYEELEKIESQLEVERTTDNYICYKDSGGNEYYHIPDDKVDISFGAKTRFKDNVEAIKLLKTLEEENRNATAEEQTILAKYVGWGGIADAFSTKKEEWQKEYNELKCNRIAQSHILMCIF